MKKVKKLFLLSLMVLGLASCSSNDPYEKATESGSQFDILCQHSITDVYNTTCYFLRDKDTNIIYIKFNDKNGISVYYDEHGQVMTYETFQKVHKH